MMKNPMKRSGPNAAHVLCVTTAAVVLCAILAVAVSASADAGLGGMAGTAGNTADSGLIASEQAEPLVPNYAGENSVVSAPGANRTTSGTNPGTSNGTNQGASNSTTGGMTGKTTNASGSTGSANEGTTGMGSASRAGRSSTTVSPSGTPRSAGENARSDDTTLGDTDGNGVVNAAGSETAGEAVSNAANAVRDTVRFHPLALLALLAAIVVLVIVTRPRKVRT
ncbi:MAG: hypothetical protein II889_05370 [Clostridia bacterium]|nr:hypothetical protein [Clostridia bacterium]